MLRLPERETGSRQINKMKFKKKTKKTHMDQSVKFKEFYNHFNKNPPHS